MRRHRPYPGDFVGGDGDTQPRAADQERAVDFALEDEFGGGDGDVRVEGFVCVVRDADVGDGGDEGVGGEVVGEGGFVGVPGFVAADGNAEGLLGGGHGACDVGGVVSAWDLL